jgi:hypothetical protein
LRDVHEKKEIKSEAKDEGEEMVDGEGFVRFSIHEGMKKGAQINKLGFQTLKGMKERTLRNERVYNSKCKLNVTLNPFLSTYYLITLSLL